MAITKTLHYGLRWLYKSIAIVLVVIAVLISCLRLLLPYAENYRNDLQNYINNTYQTNVLIGHLNTGWGNKGPTLLVKNVSLLNAQGLEIFIGSLEVDIDFWKSIQHRQLVTTNFTIDKAKVFIEPQRFDSEKSNAGERVIIEQLSDLFLTQIPRFTVNDSQIKVLLAGTPQTFSISQLAWMNKGKRHQGQGDVIVNGLSSNKLKLLIDLYGDQHDEINGQAYFEANNIDVASWLNDIIVIGDETDSAINFQSWLNIENGNAKKLIVQLGDNHITWQEQQNINKLTIDEGYFVVQASENYDYLGFYSSPIRWQVGDIAPQSFEFNAHLAFGNFSGYFSQLDIESAVALTPLFVEEQAQRNLVEAVGAQGYLKDVFFQYQNNIKFVTNFHDISIQYHENVPGVENITGQLSYYRNKAALNIRGENGELDFGQHFKRAIPYEQLSADLVLSFNEGVFAQINNLTLVSEELNFSGTAAVDVPKKGEAGMSLLAHVDDGKGALAKHYYPHLLMGKDLINYLDMAIVDGSLSDTEIIFDGKFADFPFTSKPGVFNVNARLSDANFTFSSSWPAIEELDATIDFTNNSMLITAHSGSLKGLEVKDVYVAIEDLSREQVLTVDAKFEEQKPQNVSALMNASSLADSVGKVLETAVIEKDISGEFSLLLPLNNVDDAVAQGTIHFDNNDLLLTVPEMQFSNLYGELTFRNDAVNLEELRANWRGMPMTVQVKAKDLAQHYDAQISFQGQWTKDLWQLEIPEPLQKYIDGEINWQGDLSLIIPRDSGFSYELEIVSDLTNNRLNLPAPYGKLNEELASFNMRVEGDLDSSILEANIRDNLRFFGELDHASSSFVRSHLFLGDDQMMLPIRGFYITTMLYNASVNEWQPLISDILRSLPDKNTNSGTPSLFPNPEKIQGYVDNLTVFDETFSGMSFNVQDMQNWWQLNLNSAEARGDIKFYPDWLAQGVEVEFDFLNLKPEDSSALLENITQEINPSSEQLAQSEEIDEPELAVVEYSIDHAENQKLFKEFPPIRVNCQSCRVGNFDLGKVEFEIARETDQLIILKNFNANRKGLNIELSGQWLMEDDYSSSQLAGDIAIKKIEAEMDKLGFDSIIKDSGADLTFDINWQGGIHDFSFATLNGKVHSEIDDGYLADVSDTARIFSILSLQSLVRKLTLDFRDVFADGMFYSEIKGDAIIEKGIVYTDNMKMKGSAGDLWMKGNTNMVSGELDYRMSYKPNLTSSLPILGWIATLNPVALIAGVAIDEVITSNVVSEFTFELTGTVEDPNLEEIDRKNVKKHIKVGHSIPSQEVKPEPETDEQIKPMQQYAPIYEGGNG